MPGLRSRPLRLVAAGASAFLGLVLLLAVVAGLRAAAEAERARELLGSLGTATSQEEAGRRLAESRAALQEARALLRAPAPRIVSAVPVLGRSWRAERVLLDAASEATATAAGLLDTAAELQSGGQLDPALLQVLAQRAAEGQARVAAALARVDGLDVGWTPPPVSEAVDDAAAELRRARDGLGASTQAADLLASLLGGPPRTMLIALQNNAELRGTGGYVSTFALARVGDGDVEVGPFRDVLPVADYPSTARRVPAPAEYVEDYGQFLADTTLWRNWTMSPDIPVAAEVGARAGSLLLGTRIDLVLLLDVPALSALLGLDDQPVTVQGKQVRPDELVDALLDHAYTAAGASRASQDERRAQLRAQAGRVVQRLLTAEVPVARLGETAARLARGRHLALWSADAEQQQVLRHLGLAGGLEHVEPQDDLSLVALNNLGASKLDYYVERRVSVHAVLEQDEARVVQRASFDNQAPQDLVPYVAGEVTPGVARERIELSVAPGARVTSVLLEGEPVDHDVRQGQDRTRVVLYALVPRGEPVDVEVEYALDLPEPSYRLHLVPQPLAEPAHLEVHLRAGEGAVLAQDGDRRHELRQAGPFEQQQVLEVAVRQESLGEALGRWWREPVSLPW